MYYVETNDENFSAQLNNFANKLPAYVDLFNLTSDDVSSAQKDSAYFEWAITAVNRQSETKKGWIGFKNNLRHVVPNVVENPYPETVDVLPIPSVVLPGVQLRFTIMANRIKSHNNYTPAIGQVLGIVSTNSNRLPTEDVQPTLKVVMRGGLVNLDWKKGAYDGIAIEKDSGAGFVAFDKAMRPNFIDPTSLPAASQSAVWRYRAMYLYNDERVGNWSDVVSVAVGD